MTRSAGWCGRSCLPAWPGGAAQYRLPGPEGTFTEAAALKQFGQSVELSLLASIDQVFREVEAGVCQYGVVPVENSIEGAVNHTLDMLLVSDLKLCGEVELRIHQHLLSRSENLEDIETVYSTNNHWRSAAIGSIQT